MIRADFSTQKSGAYTRGVVWWSVLTYGLYTDSTRTDQPRVTRIYSNASTKAEAALTATVRFCMVDLGVLPAPLAPSAFRMDSKFDFGPLQSRSYDTPLLSYGHVT